MIRRAELWRTWIALLVGLLLTVAVAEFVRRDIVDAEAQRLELASQQILMKIREKMDTQALMLRASAEFLKQPGGSDPDRWRSHVANLQEEPAMGRQAAIVRATWLTRFSYDSRRMARGNR